MEKVSRSLDILPRATMSSSHLAHSLAPPPPAPRAVNDADALYSFKLLEALRSGEIARIHPFLNDLTKTGADEDAAGSLLAKAIKCATCPFPPLSLRALAARPLT